MDSGTAKDLGVACLTVTTFTQRSPLNRTKTRMTRTNIICNWECRTRCWKWSSTKWARWKDSKRREESSGPFSIRSYPDLVSSRKHRERAIWRRSQSRVMAIKSRYWMTQFPSCRSSCKRRTIFCAKGTPTCSKKTCICDASNSKCKNLRHSLRDRMTKSRSSSTILSKSSCSWREKKSRPRD